MVFVIQMTKKLVIQSDIFLLKISPVFANGAVDDRKQVYGMQ